MIELAAVEVWAGNLAAAAVHVDNAVVSARAVGHKRLLSAALSHRAFIELVRGEAQTSAITAAEALSHATEGGLMGDAYVDRARVTLGWSAFLRLDFEEAEERLSELDGPDSQRLDWIVSIFATMLRAFLLMESGRIDEAQRVVAATPEAPGPLPTFIFRALALLRWHCAAATGDRASMSAQAAVLSAAGFDVEVDLLNALDGASAGDPNEAIAKIEVLVEALAPTDPVLAAAGASARVALLLRTGDRLTARQGISDLLSRVAPQRTVHAMTSGALGEPGFFELLSEESRRRDGHPFAAGALQALSRYQDHAGGPIGHSVIAIDRGFFGPRTGIESEQRLAVRVPSQRPPEVSLDGFPVRLTSREADVLEQLALHSYTEIGQALFITEKYGQD